MTFLVVVFPSNRLSSIPVNSAAIFYTFIRVSPPLEGVTPGGPPLPIVTPLNLYKRTIYEAPYIDLQSKGTLMSCNK